jgi:tetratricopeptide (TPR) repeat protein
MVELFKPRFHILLIILLSLIAYANTFQVPFVFDDEYYIVENQRIKDITNIPSFFIDIKGPKGSNPLTLTTFAVNYYLGGLNTFGYHVFNMMLHIINGILLYHLIIITAGLLNYTKKNLWLIALFSSLVFITHPVQTECVTNIVGRSTPLLTVFFLSGMIFFVKAVTSEKRKNLYIILLFMASLAGMATSEKFVTFPLILILYDFFFVSQNKVKTVVKNYKIHLPVISTLIYLAYLMLSYQYEDISSGRQKATPLEYLMTQFNVHWTYLRLLFLPVNQTIDYDYPFSRSLFEIPTMFSAIGYAGLWTGGILLFKKRPIISFCILWFMITLSPVSSIVPLNNVIFEHRLYLPSIGIITGFTLSIFTGFGKLNRTYTHPNRIPAMLSILIVVLLTGLTLARNNIWRDEIRLWEDTALKSPLKAKVHINLGNAYKKQNLIDKAIQHYKTAIKINPNISIAHYNLGNVYYSQGLVDKAIQHYKTAIKIDPNYAYPYNNLGNVYYSQGLVDKAIQHYKTAIKINPNYAYPYNNLGNVYYSQGLVDKAIQHYKTAIKIDPNISIAHYKLGSIYYSQGLVDKAIQHYESALKLGLSIPMIYYNLGNIYYSQGLVDKAIDYYKKAIQLNPKYAEAYNNLGNVYMNMSELEKAEENYKFAIAVRSEWLLPHLNLGQIYLKKGEREKARIEFKKVLQIDPQHKGAQRLLNMISHEEVQLIPQAKQ